MDVSFRDLMDDGVALTLANGDVAINMSRVLGGDLTLDSPVLPALVKLLQLCHTKAQGKTESYGESVVRFSADASTIQITVQGKISLNLDNVVGLSNA